ncbi:MOSC and FAD-binding oxidoreductase domain-containing protein [Mycolicibacterium mengxianglii]|uniref:MOSC and FAD-binding oxidoreductase domain-containing protein n=1 Tax=Mycolicibacterium mengxianglii TaxID=2736649 RepID=UPI0018EF355D|nr:MOSC and FAD-binding oxidoreductase domain-containing protein [Mycolicibacterium mengxianglii]
MSTLISVNVGLPRDVTWNNRTVHTGVWKSPVRGPRMVGRLNITGDGQGDLGGHGGEHRAVLVYQTGSYRHWAQQLQRDDLTPGSFGENLTVDGLPDDEVCIGDRYRIGEVVLEVSQPRVTCYRVGLRLGEPRMAALLVMHRRPGFYCRVISEGSLEAGQPVVKVKSGPEQVTVAEVDALLYLPGHPQDGLLRALRVPALSPGWQESLRNLVAQGDGAVGSGNSGLTAAAALPPPAWNGFRPLTVTEARDESGHVRSLTLADPDGAPLPKWVAGQFITVRLQAEGTGPSWIRNYSLSNATESGTYRIGVKEEPQGAASGFLKRHVHIGDQIDVAAPRGTFVLADGDGPVVLLSAGIGVTPVLSMLNDLAGRSSTRQVWWLHGARDGTEHPFLDEARRTIARLEDGHCYIAYSRPRPSDRRGTDYTVDGRLGAAALASLQIPRDADVYVCGPDAFMTGIVRILAEYGIDGTRIHTEQFGVKQGLTPGISTPSRPPHPPSGPVGSGPEVTFARSDLSVSWDSGYGALLELAEACDVPTRWSCRTGVCHNCETAVHSGAVSYDPEPIEAPALGNVLLCCAQPVEDLVLDL